MEIYTKKGDLGYTDLYNNERVPKSDKIIDTLGHIDELTSWLGIIRSSIDDSVIKKDISNIQKNLIEVMAEIANDFSSKKDFSDKINYLEKQIDIYKEQFPEINRFILPGETKNSSLIDVARATARRAERSYTQLNNKEGSMVGKYLNRLSDYLYTLARKIEFYEKVKEVVDFTIKKNSPFKQISQRNGLVMNLKLAKEITNEVEKEATKLNCQVVIAIVNQEGNPILIHRMDDAFIISFSLARKKAYTAAALKMPTHELRKLTKDGAPFNGLENMLDEEIVTLGGGFPIFDGNNIIGAIGVSGSTVENDQYLSEYGVKYIERVKK